MIMKSVINFRSRVMKYAWQLFRATKQAWRICMLKAWQLWRLAKSMKEGTRTFWYQKTDGTIRKANGTLKNVSSYGRRITKPSYKTMTYFDLDKNQFRCFRIENLICVI